MKLYNKTFALTEAAIDHEAIEYIPCEGTIIPLHIESIEGLEEQLYQFGYINPRRKKIPERVRIYIPEEDGINRAILCVWYPNEKYSIIHAPTFQLEEHDIECLQPELLTAWEQFVPYKVS